MIRSVSLLHCAYALLTVGIRQATVLLLVPYETWREDVQVVIERNYLLAGVRGQSPIVKGRLYGNVDVANSAWQLEPRSPRLSARERTTSTISSTSTTSSYAFVSDPDISSSFAASLESAQASDAEEPATAASPALSSPSSNPEERVTIVSHLRRQLAGASGAVSPADPARALSSFSSLESLHSQTGRLLTLHLEKEQSIIWPSLIVGPVLEELSPAVTIPQIHDENPEVEQKYNMDPTSLVLCAIELLDIRKDKDEAFECFARAWHQAHLPSATMKLIAQYLPLHTSIDFVDPAEENQRGTVSYCIRCIGGSTGLGQLFFEAGLLYLEGIASVLLSSSYSSLASIRVPHHPPQGEAGSATGRRDREAAKRCFERAKALNPALEIPSVVFSSISETSPPKQELEMPSIELHHSRSASVYSGEAESLPSEPEVILRRRKAKKDELLFMDDVQRREDADGAWYGYMPGIVGAGTALLVVGVIGALSFSWRRNQGS
ncbi:hypothetical protein CONPUDRAFT_50874 [Coniophora puteana RWD-64-598 SS2]|uniref:CS domain-containing protein n=1 Tax=Coniophora puteana (strain RWD-64-598) TaxID=741705 RepID=A0A5M3MXY3_CONPW|nr:uncharacterized protein CONPUDRAFT_50874 [Coniophora puteana RWD-64-598 SS2]EIW83988.1 hypothetical protein CONPUDRAFT_50874 [Coniophora puteana RWD-64-598 SS2]